MKTKEIHQIFVFSFWGLKIFVANDVAQLKYTSGQRRSILEAVQTRPDLYCAERSKANRYFLYVM